MSVKIRERRDGKVVRMQAEIYAIKPGALKAERTRINVPRSITSKSAAVRWAEAVRRDIEAGKPPPQTREARVKVAAVTAAREAAEQAAALAATTVAAWVELWEADERARRVRETTLRTRRNALAYLVGAFPDRPVASISEIDFARLRRDMSDLKSSTANLYLGTIVQCLNAAHAMKLREVALGPQTVRRTEVESEPEHYAEDEAAQLVAAAAELGPRYLAAMLLGLDAGLRAGEIAGLRREDIAGRDLKIRRSIAVVGGQRTIHPPKNGKERTVPISAPLAAALAAVEDHDGWLICAADGNPTTVKGVVWIFYAVQRQAGLSSKGPHKARHTFASHALRAGTDIKTLSKLLGHASIKQTERYTHTSDQAQRQAIDDLTAHRTRTAGVTDLARARSARKRAGRTHG